MNLKRFALVCILLAIFTMGAVSASDINETSDDLIGVNDSPMGVGESRDTDIQSSVDGEIITTGEKSFDDIQTLIDGASEDETIVLSGDYLGDGTGIIINKKVTIDGNNSTLDAGGSGRIFQVSTSNVIIKNINFINGHFAGNGGAVYWSGVNGSVVNCSFMNCSADYGGAVHFEGVSSVVNCSFLNCSAKYEGGAVCFGGDSGSLLNCSFVNCSAANDGGAIYWEKVDGSVVGCSFVNCSASFGEAIYCDDSNSNAVVSKCDFYDERYGSLGDVVLGATVTDCTLNEPELSGVDLEISLVSNATVCQVADLVELAVSVSNIGSDSASGVYVNLTFPASLTLLSDTSGGSYNGNVWTIGDLSTGQTANFTMVCRVMQAGNITVSSNVTSSELDLDISNNFDSVNITSVAVSDLQVTSTVNCTEAGVGENIGFTIDVFNNGPCDATDVQVAAFLDPRLVMISNVTLSGYYDADYGIWHAGNLTSGSGASLFITCQAIVDGNITLTSTVSSNENDSDDSNNADSASVTVQDSSGTFEDLQTLIDNAIDTLTLTRDYFGAGSQISISKSITIDGKNHILDAKGASGIFDVTVSDVVIKNINFRNGNFSDSQWGGGAILWCGENGHLENCSFVNCSAVNGGAVYWYCDGGSILNCDFADCHADSGAVYWEGNDGSLLNCDFANCSAVNGPAICWAGTGGDVSDCSFKDCQATGSSGGAVHWYYHGTGGSISGCSFVNCSATSAGALYWNSADGNISGCSFVNCSAQYGGAIHLWADSGSVFNCTFENCSGSESGVVYVWGDSCNVVCCEFVNCSGTHVGAIRWIGSGGSVSKCVLVNCHHANKDRAIIYSTYKLNVSDTKFETSYADDICIRTNGGIISNCTLNGILMSFFSDLQALIDDADGTITLSQNYTCGGSPVIISKSLTVDGAGCTLDANKASRIFYITASNVIIKNVKFINAKSDSDGGAIYWTGTGGILNNCNFENCSADAGGAVYSSANISNSTFINCSARVRGALDGGNVFNCSFINCSSSYVDGAICTEGTVSGCNFTNCSSYSHAGAIGDARYILNCNFVNCHSHEWGGAISSDNSTVSNCNFINCSSGTGGGSAINCGWGNVSDCNFLDCHADGGGSTFFCQYGVVSNCVFVNCSYNNYCGGAVAFDKSGNVSDSIFINCSSFECGAVLVEHVDDANILRCLFINCSAVQAGGAIVLKGDNGASIIDCSFINCTVDGFGGGAVEINAKNVFILNSSFEFNHAEYGGAVIVRAANTTISQSNFTSNDASDDGGAIYWDGDGGYCVGCRFINCTATSKGGALYWRGENGKIEDAYFNVTQDNYAVYCDSNLTVLKSRFESKIASSLNTLVRGANVLKCSLNDEPLEKTDPQINVGIIEGELGQKQIVNVFMPSDAVGEIGFELFKGDVLVKSDSCELYNAFTSWEFSDLALGAYAISIHYSGDLGYNEITYNAKFVVRPKVTITQNVTVGDEANIYFNLSNGVNDKVVIKIDGKIFDVMSIKNGIANHTFSTEGISAGSHAATFLYENDAFDGDVFNYWDSKSDKFSPFKYSIELKSVDLTMQEDKLGSDNSGIVVVELPNDANGTLTVFVNGVKYKVFEVIDGVARIDLSEFKDGIYKITFVYSGNEKYSSFSKDVETSVRNDIPGIISAGDINVLYTTSETYSVVVMTKTGKALGGIAVSFFVNGRAYGNAVTNANGVASISITSLPGSYQLTSAVSSLSAVKTLRVSHLISLKKVNVKKSAKKIVLTASLAKVNGKFLKSKKITFKFNGKKYVAKTNKKGVAKVTVKSSVLKKLKAGKKVKYQATYLKDTVSYSVKIKK